jgi:Na+-transporting NADH:ubiquinone oxidoreductase subunit NqrD
VVSQRKQRLVSIVLAAVFVPAVVGFFVYLFATGSPDAVPLLLSTVGLAAGYFVVYLAARYFGRGNSTTGRLVRGILLAALCVGGLALNMGLPFDGTSLGSLLKGLGYGVGLSAFLSFVFVLLLPPSPSGWVR